MEGSGQVAHPLHVVLLNFSDANKRWLVRSVHSQDISLPAERAAKQQGGRNKLAEMKEPLYEYSSSAVVAERDFVLLTSFANKRDLKIRVLRKGISILKS